MICALIIFNRSSKTGSNTVSGGSLVELDTKRGGYRRIIRLLERNTHTEAEGCDVIHPQSAVHAWEHDNGFDGTACDWSTMNWGLPSFGDAGGCFPHLETEQALQVRSCPCRRRTDTGDFAQSVRFPPLFTGAMDATNSAGFGDGCP